MTSVSCSCRCSGSTSIGGLRRRHQAWTDITETGLDQLCFGWAGPVKPGAGHYYTLSGPSLLI
ncbi:MAG TPA: DUF3500 domain-containing protein, partial [Propionibacteriaceae bacterium]|nr:DUF3500 domain-containing protein [Propionibacteriaceae bacterium]